MNYSSTSGTLTNLSWGGMYSLNVDPWWPRYDAPAAIERSRSIRIGSNKVASKHLLDRSWPCAVATRPGPPPVELALAAEPEERAIAAPHEAHPPPARARLSARQSVPSRTRRKLRTWERDR